LAERMLATGVQQAAARSALEALAKNDPITIVQEVAQAVLDAYAARSGSSPAAAPPDYVFGARCPNGHVSYFDKREYCPKNSIIIRRVVTRGGRDVEEVLVRCKTGCRKEFYVEVDCAGYK
jgi:hypothetical protein